MSKVAVSVTLNPDDEIKALADGLAGLGTDIASKKAALQTGIDLVMSLAGAAGDIGNAGTDLKANPDNYAYVGLALGKVAATFLSVPAAAVPVV